MAYSDEAEDLARIFDSYTVSHFSDGDLSLFTKEGKSVYPLGVSPTVFDIIKAVRVVESSNSF